ncbi:hypothetical protein P3X46_028065 [Hevea brasiliensis]|uniref:Uncharacterized protein n=1 Tax=Hevea brasiliensis TaxID=3981 RepID=A0ABQ9KNP7_HEVBR|nr:protein NODULATION SIGNALING PATHWAY 2-like [Hevea brasiliensis]KAJ9145719.1 hypothetical protein P3X46_028065 [Hevea brasiliensis]
MVDGVKDFGNCMVSHSSILPPQEYYCLGDDVELENLHMLPIASKHQSMDICSKQAVSLFFPSDGVEVDDCLSIVHLLKAYGEAMEIGLKELAEVITLRLKEKGCPTGSTLQRLACYLIQALDKQASFLREEAIINYEIAFSAFYQTFPYGRFAHFTANSVILEAIPEDAEIVHIVDFDIGKGVQWPPIIEALAMQGQGVVVRFTSIKWEEEEGSSYDPPFQSFEETKMLLCEHARYFGLRLKVEERDLVSLDNEMKKTNKRGGGGEWLAFNCMVGLPHMEERRSVRSVIEFLKVAKDSIRLNCKGGGGTITFGDGIGWGKGLQGWTGFGYIFEGQLAQFKTLLESIDSHFSHHLREAKIAIECLFLIPYFSFLIDMQMWKDISGESRALSEVGLVPWRIRKDNLLEAKELVREGESSYYVDIEGVPQNQMVLGYMGTPLVKVSSWR